MTCLHTLAAWFPQPVVTQCDQIERTLLRLFDKELPDHVRFYPHADADAYFLTLQQVHYLAFIPVAVAHGCFVLNVWPHKTWYQWHLAVAEWIEGVAYGAVSGLGLLIYFGAHPSLLELRVAVEFMTIGGFFFVKGVSHVIALGTRNRLFGSFRIMHLLLIAFLLWDLDRSDTFFTSNLYRFAASLYALGAALLFHREVLRAENRYDGSEWPGRVTHVLAHLMLFAAHVMLAYIGSLRELYLQWFLHREGLYPVQRVLMFDWIVLALHLTAFLVTMGVYLAQIVAAGVRRQIYAVASRDWVTTLLKWIVALLTLVAAMILAIVARTDPVIVIQARALGRAHRLPACNVSWVGSE